MKSKPTWSNLSRCSATSASLLDDWRGRPPFERISDPLHALVVGDCEATSEVIREVLVTKGYACAAEDLMALSSAAGTVPRDAELVVVHISSDPQRALVFLAELRRVTTGRIIAVGPNGDAKLILLTLRHGAEHYLDEGEVEQELRDTLAQIQALRALELHEPGRSVCVIKSSGGSGSSTLAANLAVLLAQEHKSCALLDLDLATDDLTALLNLKPAATLVDLGKYSTDMDRFVFERSLTRHATGVSLLASSWSHEDLAQISTPCIREVLDWARTLFPQVVVDIGQPFQEVKLEALRVSEVILLVFRLDFSSLRNVKRLVDHLEKNGIGRERVILVVNRYGQPKELSASEAEGSLGMKIGYYIADDARTANEANNKGIPMVLDAPRSTVSKSIVRLVKGLALAGATSASNGDGRPAKSMAFAAPSSNGVAR